MIRGVKQQIEIFEMFMQTQMWKWDRLNVKTNKIESIMVQGAYRESALGIKEYVFPRECYDEVMTMLSNQDDSNNFNLNSKLNGEKLPIKALVLRKMLGNGVYSCPKWKIKPSHHFVERRGVEIYLIGVKDDKTDMSPDGQPYLQEML